MKIMKRLMAALFAFALLGITTACEKDNDNNNGGGNGGNASLVGTWKINQITANGTDITQMIPEDVQIGLEANGSGSITIFSRTERFSWTATSSTLTVTTPSNETINCTIVSLTNTTCTLTSNNMTFPVMGDIEGEVTITLTKVGGGDNPTPDNNYSTLIVGTWQTTQTFANGQDVTAMVGNVQLTFAADGRGLLNHNGETENNGFGWSINGSTMTINPDHGSSSSFTIVSLDSQTCTFTGTRMPGSDQTFNEIRITMAKVNNPNPNPNPDPITNLVGTSWSYTLDTSFTETYEESTINISATGTLTLSFTTVSAGTMSMNVAMQASIGGIPVPELSGNQSRNVPFTYVYNESTRSGSLTATMPADDDEDEDETIILPFTYNAELNALVVINPDPDPMMPQTIIFTRR